MNWTLPILARDSYTDQRIELETPSAVLVSATEQGKRRFVAITKNLYTDFILAFLDSDGEVRVLYDRPEAFAASFRVNVRKIMADYLREREISE